MSTCNLLHNEYLKLVNPQTDRARNVSAIEDASPHKMRDHDIAEASSVIQLYLSGLELGVKSLLSGDLEKFDAVIGDHNCHVTASVALEAFQETALLKEAEQLLELVKSKKGKINLKSSDPKPPHVLMAEFGYPMAVSEKMKYLICAAILRSGTECTELPDGSMILKVLPNQIQQRLSKKCSLELVTRLITPLRECINLGSVAAVQRVAQTILTPEESGCLNPKVGKTLRNETFQFPCAFYNMKASLLNMIKSRTVHFAVVKYDPKRMPGHPPLVFDPHMRLVNPAQLDPNTPVFVIQSFFNDALSPVEIGRQLEEYGLERYLLASIAVNAQFLDMKKAAFANDEDIQELPLDQQREIKLYREEGKRLRIDSKDPAICRVVHTYADTLKNLGS
jgi:hypothetical protein